MLLRTLTCSLDQALATLSQLESSGFKVAEMPLKSLPKGMHWHVSKPGQKGTLEATWNEDELRFEVRSNRTGDWQTGAVKALA